MVSEWSSMPPASNPSLPVDYLAPSTPYSLGADFDFFSRRGADTSPSMPRYRNTFRSREVRDSRGKGIGVIEWTLTVWDFHGGLNASWGDFNAIPNRISSSTAWTQYPGHITLPYDIPTGTNVTLTNAKGVHHCNVFSTMAIGIGSGADSSLWIATTGAPSARTYSPTTSITGLHPIVIGGATAAEQLVVCRSGTEAQVLSDLAATPTSVGTMAASTNPSWGMIMSPLNATTPGTPTILGYNGQTIATLASTAAVGDAWTTALSNVPGGGYALGISEASGTLRAWWVWPKAHTSGGMLADSTTLGRLVSTNLEGTDPQTLDIPLKNGITQAAIWNGGIAYTDGKEDYWYKGGYSRNLRSFVERETITAAGGIADTIAYSTLHFMVAWDRLYAVRQKVVNSTPGNRTAWWELFDPETWSWHQVSETLTTGDKTNSTIVRAGGSLPFSWDGSTSFLASATSTGTQATIYRQPIPSPSINPMFLGTQDFATPATVTSPVWTLPGLINVPSVVEEIIFGGYLNSNFGFSLTSSGDASVAITIGAQGKDALSTTSATVATFQEADRANKRRRTFETNTNAFTNLQLTLTLTQAASNASKTTPNAGPFQIRGLAFPDGFVRSPQDVRKRAAA